MLIRIMCSITLRNALSLCLIKRPNLLLLLSPLLMKRSRKLYSPNEEVTCIARLVRMAFKEIFLRQYWELIDEPISMLVSHTFRTGLFNLVIAETLIALIPKIDCPTNFKEFRLIILCNTIYKLIS